MAEAEAAARNGPPDNGAGVGIHGAAQQGAAAMGGTAAANALIAFGAGGGVAGHGAGPAPVAGEGGGDPADPAGDLQPPAGGAEDAHE